MVRSSVNSALCTCILEVKLSPHHLLINKHTYLHDGPVVHTVNEDFVDTGGLKCVFGLQVSWNLGRGSGWGEGSGEANDDHVFPSSVFSGVNHVRGETRMEVGLGDGVAWLDRSQGSRKAC